MSTGILTQAKEIVIHYYLRGETEKEIVKTLSNLKKRTGDKVDKDKIKTYVKSIIESFQE